MEELFKNISEEENCACKIIYEKAYAPYVLLPFFMRKNGAQVKTLVLKILYQNQNIDITYELSKTHVAEIKCRLNQHLTLPEFQGTNRSHYWRIFNRKTDILKVDCNDKTFYEFVKKSLSTLQIEKIARNFKFEPVMKGYRNDGNYEIITSYHLSFPAKKDILKPIINFHKSLIDFALDRGINEVNANIG